MGAAIDMATQDAVVAMPEAALEEQQVLIRQMQAELVAEMPGLILGAHTVQYGPNDYAFEPGIGQIHYLPTTSQRICKDLAQSYLALIGNYPLVSPIKPTRDSYEFVGRLGIDPVNEPEPVNWPTMEYYRRFLRLLHERNFKFVNSVAYEILDFFMPEEWKQRNWLGLPAQSGWYPPSSFIQPANEAPLDYIAKVQVQILKAGQEIGMVPYFQIGEPWWWDGSYNNGEGKNAPCLYDQRTMDLYKQETGNDVPMPMIKSIFDPVADNQWPYIDWLRTKLGDSTNYVRDKVKATFPDAQATLLFFSPQVMSPASDLTFRLNFPMDEWVYPNYEFVQIEDYDWIIDGRLDLVPQTFTAATELLKYPLEVVHYFIGFTLLPEDAKRIWGNTDKAWALAQEAGIKIIYPWSYTQVMRDGVYFARPKVCGC
ncbi:tail assembly protein [Achromobacter phage vB_AxyP_19-32_Axy24]|uniref:Putative capsid and scaffold protein n=1 Tax=Achromobacter phage vB_AxyP_19-32_Axy24 TaxID=2591048 RepID=A0A514CW83_9CAUD|nr:tail assembly protein [Achromobacter phage vB_AxyP_19-32_Axy24]QDH84733.1 putative capsid and scaffold protein [Achromobacter phage vB_AxyP_19-32_Axy24]